MPLTGSELEVPLYVRLTNGTIYRAGITGLSKSTADALYLALGATAGGDLAGTYPNPTIKADVIVDADVNTAANIAQTKIAGLTASLAGKSDTAHTHTQAQSHNSPDTDTGPTSLHHTLGTGANQAATGNHTHTQAQSHGSPDTDTGTTSLHHTIGTGGFQAAAGNHAHAGVYDPAGTAASAITTHEAAADPHTGYQKETEKAAANGYASLDASVKVPIAQVPTGTTGTTVSLGNHAHAGVYDPAGTASSAITTHEAAADPHTGYQRETEKAAANGYASLDGTIKVPIAQIPTGTTSTTVPLGNDARFTDARTPTGTASGDLTGTYPSPTILTDAVTNTKLANMAANSFKGNNTGSAADPIDMTVTQAKTLLALVKGDVGLGNVDNTADTAKPVSTAQQTALNLKLDLAGGTLTGNLTVNRSGGTSSVVCQSTSGTAYLQARSIAGTQSGLQIVDNASGLARWIVGKTVTTEVGSNSGSDFAIYAYNDAGTYLNTPLSITRSNGLATVAADPQVNLGIATKQYVDTNGFTRTVSVISGNTTLSATKADYVYVCTAALTATLPTAVGNKNLYTVKRTGAGNVTVATTGGQTIDGAANFIIDVQYQAMDFISDGANWVIV